MVQGGSESTTSDAGSQSLRRRPSAVRCRRRARGGVVRWVVVLQPEPGGVPAAGSPLPRRQHGAVRGAGAARRSGDRPLRLGHRGSRVPVRPARRRARRRWWFRCSTWRLYFFALALLFAAKAIGVIRQALVPGLVDDPVPPVAADSRLARLSVWPAPPAGWPVAGCWPSLGITGRRPLWRSFIRRRGRVPSGCRRPTRTRGGAAGVAYEELHRPTIVATAWAFTAVRAAVGFFVFGLAFALRRASEPAWMYGAAVAAYGVGTFVGNSIAPLLRRRYGEDRLTAGALVALAVVAAFGALGPSRALVLLVSVVLGGAASVAGRASTRWCRPTPRGRRAAVRSPASRPGSSSAGCSARSPPRPSPSRSASASPSSPWCCSRRRGCTCAPAGGRAAHVEDPFDPSRLARRRIDHAVEWQSPRLDRLAVTELAGVVDLAGRPARPRPPSLDARVVRLRATAAVDLAARHREVDWAIARAGHARPAGADGRPATDDSANGAPDDGRGLRRRRRERPRTRSRSTATNAGRSSARLRPVVVGAVDLDLDVDRIALRGPARRPRAAPRRRGPACARLVLDQRLGPFVGEAHLRLSRSSPMTSAWTSAAIALSPTATT